MNVSFREFVTGGIAALDAVELAVLAMVALVLAAALALIVNEAAARADRSLLEPAVAFVAALFLRAGAARHRRRRAFHGRTAPELAAARRREMQAQLAEGLDRLLGAVLEREAETGATDVRDRRRPDRSPTT
ncbi:hypothetical protein [Glycomyces artemisiae]|uniref:Uncharacterized protein n=1 Tax=Glycomyces artemisiae TaxID=1076443 RepID=A0A2T0UEW6_9ACTN|nr:hypothetical protein [Glycomyces artemisiae]PRY56486.1 hypothetical protein B0I28_109135 [Glycomyces artemisiae]